jgi:hypothetical protein
MDNRKETKCIYAIIVVGRESFPVIGKSQMNLLVQ